MLRSHPDGYYDTREEYTARNLETYKLMVFDENWEETKPNAQPGSITEQSLQALHGISFFVPSKDRAPQKLTGKNYEWDLPGGEPFGGEKSFFERNAIVLDLGSGKGIAKDEINIRYGSIGLQCLSYDFRYLLRGYDTEVHPFYEMELPKKAGSSVAGGFDCLPFADNSFNRILSVESFPAWLPKGQADFNRYFTEITRVSQKGAIWRGTLPSMEGLLPSGYKSFSLEKAFCENGWEVIFPHKRGYFIAHLVDK